MVDSSIRLRPKHGFGDEVFLDHLELSAGFVVVVIRADQHDVDGRSVLVLFVNVRVQALAAQVGDLIVRVVARAESADLDGIMIGAKVQAAAGSFGVGAGVELASQIAVETQSERPLIETLVAETEAEEDVVARRFRGIGHALEGGAVALGGGAPFFILEIERAEHDVRAPAELHVFRREQGGAVEVVVRLGAVVHLGVAHAAQVESLGRVGAGRGLVEEAAERGDGVGVVLAFEGELAFVEPGALLARDAGGTAGKGAEGKPQQGSDVEVACGEFHD